MNYIHDHFQIIEKRLFKCMKQGKVKYNCMEYDDEKDRITGKV